MSLRGSFIIPRKLYYPQSAVHKELVMLIGYKLQVPDNGTFMFRDKSALKRCHGCGYARKFLSHNPDYQTKKREVDHRLDGYFVRGADLSSTYDSYYIASKRFRDFCLREGYKGLIFREFAGDKHHFNFMVRRTVLFDARKRGTVFERLCEICKNYESVVGATPSYLLRSSKLRDGFYRTNLLFGSGDHKSPLIIVACNTKSKLASEGFKGLTFSPAYGIECA